MGAKQSHRYLPALLRLGGMREVRETDEALSFSKLLEKDSVLLLNSGNEHSSFDTFKFPTTP